MKKLLLFLTALFLLGEANAFDVNKDGEIIFKAMQDEMIRTIEKFYKIMSERRVDIE